MGFLVLLGFGFFAFKKKFLCVVWKNLAEKWKLNLLTDLITSFKIGSRFYFANLLLVELKALNIIKSLVISSMRNETGSNLGWVFCWGFWVVYPKNPPGLGFRNPGRYPGFWTLAIVHAFLWPRRRSLPICYHWLARITLSFSMKWDNYCWQIR